MDKPVTFSIHVSGIGAVANVLWDFGDGTPMTDMTATHTYDTAGTYRVTAIAWDAHGAAAFNELTIKVTGGTP